MAKSKLYKKGEVVYIWCSTHDFQSLDYEEYTLEHDMTEEELTAYAEEYFWNTKEPEWGFSKEKPESRF